MSFSEKISHFNLSFFSRLDFNSGHDEGTQRMKNYQQPSNTSTSRGKLKRLTHEKRLIRDLLDNYPTIYARPIQNITQPVIIQFGLTLTQLFDLGSTGQKMQTNTWKTFIWKDMNLIWDPLQYGGLANVCLPADSIWTPVNTHTIHCLPSGIFI